MSAHDIARGAKAVTGDPRKSVRLHLEEKRIRPFMMRMMDKAAFTVGVRDGTRARATGGSNDAG